MRPTNPPARVEDCERVASEYRAELDRGKLPEGMRSTRDGKLYISFASRARARFGEAPQQTQNRRVKRIREAFLRHGICHGQRWPPP